MPRAAGAWRPRGRHRHWHDRGGRRRSDRRAGGRSRAHAGLSERHAARRSRPDPSRCRPRPRRSGRSRSSRRRSRRRWRRSRRSARSSRSFLRRRTQMAELVSLPPEVKQETPKAAELQLPAPVTTAPQAPKVEEAAVAAAPTQGQVAHQQFERGSDLEAPGGQRCSSATSAIRRPHRRAASSGIVQLSFSLDRQGHVTSSRIAKSSGSAALDEATLELVRRAGTVPAAAAGNGRRADQPDDPDPLQHSVSVELAAARPAGITSARRRRARCGSSACRVPTRRSASPECRASATAASG